eukprot:13718322-Heterocapsa_arctica.AAC.1
MATEAADRAAMTAHAERQAQTQGAQADEVPGFRQGNQQGRPEAPSPTLQHRTPSLCSREERDRI